MWRVFVCASLACAIACGCEDPRLAPVAQQRSSDAEVFRAIQSRWRELRLGMTGDEVRGLLGDPATVYQMEAAAVWRYYPDLGGAEVRLAPRSVFSDEWVVTGWIELNWDVMASRLAAQRSDEQNRILQAYLLSQLLK